MDRNGRNSSSTGQRTFFILMAVVFPVQVNCHAQQIPNTLKQRALYERDLKIDLQDDREAILSTRDCIGTLTRTGSELLLNDAVNSQLIIVDTKTFAETVCPLDVPAFDVQFDSGADMLFVETKRVGESGHPLSNQTCYENLTALVERRPRWSSKFFDVDQQIWSLKGQTRFVVVPSYHQYAILLDQNGKKLGELKVKGSVIGVDETEQGFNLFVFLLPNNLTHIELDEYFDVRKTSKLPLANVPVSVRARDNGLLGEPRSFRLRGLQRGEVTKYFLTIATQPGYIDMRGRMPFSNLPSRLFNANKLSAAESPLQPEIIVGNSNRGNFEGFTLFDAQSNVYHDPNRQLIDAIFDNDRKLIVTVGVAEKPRDKTHHTVRLICLE